MDGVPVDQHFHQPILISTPTNSTSLMIPASTSTNLNFLSNSNSNSNFDPLLFPPLHQTLFQSNHFLPHPPPSPYDHYHININHHDSWSDDEVVQLFRIKSTHSQNYWYKHLSNWDHVSRKLAEMGYKKSSEQCKKKFEEESCSRRLNTTNTIDYCNNSYLITEEADLCINNSNHVTLLINEPPENVNHHQQQLEQKLQGEAEEETEGGQKETTLMAHDDEVKKRKRKRKHKKLKMVKGLCVDMVKKMMAQQEEMHKKLLEDMANQDEEMQKREESWRKMQMEIHMSREHEQEIERQSTITQFLNKMTSFDKLQKIQIPFNLLHHLQVVTNYKIDDHNLLLTKLNPKPKRWPRDEVLALINIRKSINVNNGCGSLWERISQGMLELGYKRSAKRCKEKWENINKYFRKTKDDANKRSLESRTCPYYHELTKLYNQSQQN